MLAPVQEKVDCPIFEETTVSDDLILNIPSLWLVPEHDGYRWSDDVVRDLRRTYPFFHSFQD